MNGERPRSPDLNDLIEWLPLHTLGNVDRALARGYTRAEVWSAYATAMVDQRWEFHDIYLLAVRAYIWPERYDATRYGSIVAGKSA